MSDHDWSSEWLPRPTRRGLAVALVALGATLMGWGFGGRSLNAVAVPALALLAVSAVGVVRVERPRVSRRLSGYATVGEQLLVDLDLTAARVVPATVRDTLPAGVTGAAVCDTTTGRRMRYSVTADRRGVHYFGPVTVTVRDTFGLWQRTFRGGSTSTVTVLPRIHALTHDAPLLAGYVGPSNDRERFDGVREYVRGDSLRDVNWKASAKRVGDLVVTEFTGEEAARSVTLGVTASDAQSADAATEAAASVAVHLLDAGLDVGVRSHAVALDPDTGVHHRRRILSLLARFEPGAAARETTMGGVDIVVSADGGVASVHIAGGETHAFETIRARQREVLT